MERLFTTQEVLESWNKSCKVNDDVDQQAKDIVREALELKIAEEQGLLAIGDDIRKIAVRERNKAIDEFAEKLVTNVESFQAEVNGIRADLMTVDYFHEYVWEIAEKMKGE